MTVPMNTPWVMLSEVAELYGIPEATIRYHCKDPRGVFHGIAVKRRGRWTIPTPAAEAWAATYKPYASMSRHRPGHRDVAGASPAKETDDQP